MKPTDVFAAADKGAVPLTGLTEKTLAAWKKKQPAQVRRWIEASGFAAKPGTHAAIADADGNIVRVLFGADEESDMWAWAALAKSLPAGTYRIEATLKPDRATAAALAWALAGYAFTRYGKKAAKVARLVWPQGADRAYVTATAEATFLVRDLINTPTSDMGPAHLAAAAKAMAARHKASFSVVVGEQLLKRNFPSIHAVGRASAADRQPRLIDIRWGRKNAPKITLVGKGVCFDTGGLDLKGSANMKLMKKDMGGAAHVLGLAHMIMAARLPVRLRVLIPAVENSVSGNAMRPLDIITSRKGLTVEIGNTDAEGRVILSDALALACEEKPALLADFATLTGAARVALGTELPALFANDDNLANELLAAGTATADPVWRLPLWKGYAKQVEGKVADLTNAPEGGFAGAITAALFLERFVAPGTPWVHLDLMAWNTASRPGRPEGGEAMAMRALFRTIADRFAR